MSSQTRVPEGWLTVADIMSRDFVSVSVGTTLREVIETFSQSRFHDVLVVDACGSLVGTLSAAGVLARLRQRPEGCTDPLDNSHVESAMVSKFVSGSPYAHPEDLATILLNGSLTCLPVLEDGKPVGIVTPAELFSNTNRLRTCANQSGTDPLTGLANRASFEQRLIEELERAHRQHTCLGLAIFGVDNFGAIDSASGQPIGDAALRMIAGCLKRNLRKYDAVARYGPDQFAAICYGCGHAQIEALIQRTQMEVSSVMITTGPDQRPITLSAGAAVLPTGSGTIRQDQLMQAAERCLERATANGGDCAFGVEVGSIHDGEVPLRPNTPIPATASV